MKKFRRFLFVSTALIASKPLMASGYLGEFQASQVSSKTRSSHESSSIESCISILKELNDIIMFCGNNNDSIKSIIEDVSPREFLAVFFQDYNLRFSPIHTNYGYNLSIGSRSFDSTNSAKLLLQTGEYSKDEVMRVIKEIIGNIGVWKERHKIKEYPLGANCFDELNKLNSMLKELNESRKIGGSFLQEMEISVKDATKMYPDLQSILFARGFKIAGKYDAAYEASKLLKGKNENETKKYIEKIKSLNEYIVKRCAENNILLFFQTAYGRR